MFKKTTLSALAVSLALPFAGVAMAGNTQLALEAGVEPGVYTTSEIIQISEARKDNDQTKLDFYLTGENRVSRSGAVDYTDNVGLEQLAATAGVSPDGYTAGTLYNLIEAQQSGNDQRAAVIEATASGNLNGVDSTYVSDAKLQYAGHVGLDANSNTWDQLILKSID